MKTRTVLPPAIIQHFNMLLLCAPVLKFGDWSGTFETMWIEALKLFHKIENNPQRKTRCENLKKEILDLYERAKAKEKDREGQTNHKTQEFGYHVAHPKGLAQDVLARLRFGRKAGSFKHDFRSNREFSKTKKVKNE